MSFGNLQKMALQMQQNMQRVEEELAAAVLEGSAGGGVAVAEAPNSAKVTATEHRNTPGHTRACLTAVPPSGSKITHPVRRSP